MPMIQNKIVARFKDGRILKGFTNDFLPTKPLFHLNTADAASPPTAVEVRIADLKAIFFVKDLNSKAQPHTHRQDFDPTKPAIGRKIRVVFQDGEILTGTTQGYDASRPGFFVVPADSASNNDRCFVVKGSTQQVFFI
jgi:hypothetical protein